MTTQAPERGAAAPPAAAAVEPGSAVRGSRGGPPPPASPERGVLATCVGAWLASSAFGIFVAGLFADPLARVVALAGALLGAGAVLASCRTRYTAAVQYAGALLTVLLGALLVLPFTTGGSANLPGLISEALHGGGLGHPPVPFDPGWRFLLFVLTGLLSEASAAAAVGLHRPKLAVGLPVPLLVGAALLEPTASAASTLASLALLVAALAASFGVQLASEGVGSARFEVRRFARGAVLAVVLVAGMAAVSRVGFLFPRAVTSTVIPPRRPPSAPLLSDRVLFTVTTPAPMTWRLGVLDVYQIPAWLLPPYDTARIQRIPASGTVPVDGPGSVVGPLQAANTITVRFTIGDLPGHGVPDLANPIAVHASTGVQYDPRTQALQLPELAPRGLSYTVQAIAPPSDGQLRAAGPPPPALAPFLAAPPPPPRVAALLARAPTGNLYDRLQFVRQAFYSSVIAAGAGNPVDVPPSLVDRMLTGQPVSPYEITAGEVLLARWAGVPARIGYGYFGGHPVPGSPGVYQVHPDDGATWLEAYFQGYGWVPIVGTPPRAKASLSSAPKQHNPTVRPTDQLALVVYVPYPQQSIRQLYQVVRYWLLRGLLALLVLVLALIGYPAVVKWLRTLRRVRWAARRGPPERIAVAYAGMREAAADLGLGGAALSPLEFLGRVEPDAEHRELAWLVVRGLWGDLRRDLQVGDADVAVEMAAS
ncbi:MAG: DUF3488 domain-containing protein, partial [Mycobacteriales bacterium]